MLTAGTRLGAYEIITPIGAGGMGEVYRARDPRLDREVAIKVLPASLAADATALGRFEREAMSVAKLSHPNILAIYEFASDGGTAFVVMELVNGETLRAKLAQGPLPPRKALAYALQIAHGIAAAHDRGIVHRDLKPENVMITRDDRVKILDFGLAKPVDVVPNDMTRAAGVSTNAGTVLGTFGYMAPEQVRGQAVDRRADIFAFGAVLYEMLSGTRAFQGETAADSMSAVLTKEPQELDLAKLAISPSVDRIIRRCLEKQADLRFQSAQDLAFALDTLSGASSTPAASGAHLAAPAAAAQAPARSSMAWLPWSIAALALIGAAALFVTRGSGAKSDGQWSAFTRITETAGEELEPTLSPDGNTVAFSVKVGASWDIYSQRVGGRNASPVVSDAARNEGGPAFSPNGLEIAFHNMDGDGGIFVAGATGESVRRVTDHGFHPAWSPDGKTIAFSTERIITPENRQTTSVLFVVDTAGGAPRQIGDGDACQPSFSPSGKRIVYWSNTSGQRDIYTIAVGGGERVPVTNDTAIDWAPTWSPDGHYIYFSSDRGGVMNLWRVAIDEASGKVTSSPEPVITGVLVNDGAPRLSASGTRLAFQATVTAINPVAIPFDPSTLRAGTPAFLDSRNNIRVPTSVSPDGKDIVYSSLGEQQEDIFISSISGANMRRITDDAARDRAPRFAPDGKSVTFYSTRSGSWQAWSIGIDGGNARQLTNTPAGATYPFISPNGDVLIHSTGDGHSFFRDAMTPSGILAATPPIPSLPGYTLLAMTATSDGMRIAGNVGRPGGETVGLFVYDVRTQKLARFVENDDAFAALWLPDNRHLLYFTKGGGTVAVVDTQTGARSVVDVKLPAPSINDLFALSPDGRMIYYGARRVETDIWVVDQKTVK